MASSSPSPRGERGRQEEEGERSKLLLRYTVRRLARVHVMARVRCSLSNIHYLSGLLRYVVPVRMSFFHIRNLSRLCTVLGLKL